LVSGIGVLLSELVDFLVDFDGNLAQLVRQFLPFFVHDFLPFRRMLVAEASGFLLLGL